MSLLIDLPCLILLRGHKYMCGFPWWDFRSIDLSLQLRYAVLVSDDGKMDAALLVATTIVAAISVRWEPTKLEGLKIWK
jgi:hypothetical protein